MNGLFITIEGPDGSGKSTIIEMLKDYFKRDDFLFTREPGGTPIAEKIRDIILDKNHEKLCPRAEALLYSASRAQHIEEKIIPAIKDKKVVISDRFVISSYAYQAFARGLGYENIKLINDFATEGLKPDLTIFFKIDAKDVLKRKFEQNDADRMELEGESFHDKVYKGYMHILEKNKNDKNFYVVDATKTKEEVFENVLNIILEKLKEVNL